MLRSCLRSCPSRGTRRRAHASGVTVFAGPPPQTLTARARRRPRLLPARGDDPRRGHRDVAVHRLPHGHVRGPASPVPVHHADGQPAGCEGRLRLAVLVGREAAAARDQPADAGAAGWRDDLEPVAGRELRALADHHRAAEDAAGLVLADLHAAGRLPLPVRSPSRHARCRHRRARVDGYAVGRERGGGREASGRAGGRRCGPSRTHAREHAAPRARRRGRQRDGRGSDGVLPVEAERARRRHRHLRQPRPDRHPHGHVRPGVGHGSRSRRDSSSRRGIRS